ncbi:MAG TPA: hypothetical protein VFV08_15775, partial [Puia sp.]|nr:hypothetical protein [Puia sp.]
MKRSISLLTCSLLLLNLILCFAAFGQQKQEWHSNKSNQEDSFDIKSASFLLPQPRPKWHYYQNLSFSYIDLPSQWTLQNINAPMLTYSGKFSLPFGFNFQEGLSTLFVSNRFNFGPSWNYSIHNYHFGIGYQFAYDFGYLNGFGYNTTFSGWEENPSVTAGYSFKKVAIILRG